MSKIDEIRERYQHQQCAEDVEWLIDLLKNDAEEMEKRAIVFEEILIDRMSIKELRDFWRSRYY